MRELRRVDHTVRSTAYTHAAQIDPRAGVYHADCSTFVSFVLERAAPKAQRAVTETATRRAVSLGKVFDRPRAESFYYRIVSTPADRAADGWQRVARVDDLAPGDVIVWLRPPVEAGINHNTGHTLVATGHPIPYPKVPNGYLVRVADVSQRHHQDDTRDRRNIDGGYGHGTILLVADPKTHAPVAFGRVGTRSPAILESGIALGRPVE